MCVPPTVQLIEVQMVATQRLVEMVAGMEVMQVTLITEKILVLTAEVLPIRIVQVTILILALVEMEPLKVVLHKATQIIQVGTITVAHQLEMVQTLLAIIQVEVVVLIQEAHLLHQIIIREALQVLPILLLHQARRVMAVEVHHREVQVVVRHQVAAEVVVDRDNFI